MKNPKLEHLRVAVVPSETGNGITQRSTYEEIVACEETMYFSVPDYFQAQNDEDLPLMHWSFLLDCDKKVECTGMNTDGIDYFDREQNIAYIKKVISEWGATSDVELELDHSPCLNSIGNGKDNVSELIERFNADGVETTVYHDEITIADNNYSYEELPDEVIDEIVEIMKNYEADMLKTEKRCQS